MYFKTVNQIYFYHKILLDLFLFLAGKYLQNINNLIERKFFTWEKQRKQKTFSFFIIDRFKT